MSSQISPHIDKYIRGGLGADYEPGVEIPGLSIFENKHIFARKNEFSTSVNSNSVVGELPIEGLIENIRAVFDFYGSKTFSWIIKSSERYAYLENALTSIGMKVEKTFFGMYLPLTCNSLEKVCVPKITIVHAKSLEQIGEVVDLSCKIFGINANEREDMIKERMSILLNPLNRSGFHLAYSEGIPVGYSRYRLSHDGKAMYLTGSGILKEYRGKRIYLSLLKERFDIAMKNGCKFLTVFAREDTSKPILEKLGFKSEGKYLFMTTRKQV